MSAEPAVSSRANQNALVPPPVTLSRWVNEPCVPLTEILSAQDVARLTRRPWWILLSLSLVGRFPKKTSYRGRPIGWCRSEVLAWMAQDLVLEPELGARRRCVRRCPRQRSLPLNFRPQRRPR